MDSYRNDCVLGLLLLAMSIWAVSCAAYEFNRSSFSTDFVEGTASSAHQIDGAANGVGRVDSFTNNHQATFGTAKAVKTRDVGFRLELTRADATRNLNQAEFLELAVQRSKMHGLNAIVHPDGEYEYIIQLSIGTPPHQFTAVLDTGSDLIWTRCKNGTKRIPQPDPRFDALSSSTFSTIPCSSKLCHAVGNFTCTPNCFYHSKYVDGSEIDGILGKETFIFGDMRIPDLAFGCSLFNSGTVANVSCIVGLGRGPLSLVSQLCIETFSYCFTSYNDRISKSLLLFGSQAKLGGKNIQTTPLIQSPNFQTSYYYLSLKGITVGKTRLSIPADIFEIKKDGTGGIIIDSGTPMLWLHQVAYTEVGKAFQSQFKLPRVNATGLDLCFKTSKRTKAIPKLIFHFEGADWDLPEENYVAHSNANLLCLLAMKSEDDSSIFGNIATQNMHVLYDLENNNLSFERTNCNEL